MPTSWNPMFVICCDKNVLKEFVLHWHPAIITKNVLRNEHFFIIEPPIWRNMQFFVWFAIYYYFKTRYDILCIIGSITFNLNLEEKNGYPIIMSLFVTSILCLYVTQCGASYSHCGCKIASIVNKKGKNKQKLKWKGLNFILFSLQRQIDLLCALKGHRIFYSRRL